MKRTGVLVMLSALLVGIVAAGAGAPFKGYVPVNIEGDLPEVENRYLSGAHFSPDGLCFAVGADKGPHAVVYVTESSGKGYGRWLPGNLAGGWLANGSYSRVIERIQMFLPDYRQIAPIDGQDLAALSTAQQLAAAAWSYCESVAAGQLPVIPELIAKNAKELADRTRECFAPQDGNTAPLMETSLATLARTRDMYFVSDKGRLYLGRQDNYPSAPASITFVSGSAETDLTPPEGATLTDLDIDPYKGRALVADSLGITVYDSTTKESWWIARPASQYDGTMAGVHLVPDAQHLIIHFFRSQENETLAQPHWLELWTIDGGFVQVIPMLYASSDVRPCITGVLFSRNLMVVNASYETAGGYHSSAQAFLAKR
jgi:hypothetical protein